MYYDYSKYKTLPKTYSFSKSWEIYWKLLSIFKLSLKITQTIKGTQKFSLAREWKLYHKKAKIQSLLYGKQGRQYPCKAEIKEICGNRKLKKKDVMMDGQTDKVNTKQIVSWPTNQLLNVCIIYSRKSEESSKKDSDLYVRYQFSFFYRINFHGSLNTHISTHRQTHI